MCYSDFSALTLLAWHQKGISFVKYHFRVSAGFPRDWLIKAPETESVNNYVLLTGVVVLHIAVFRAENDCLC